MYNEASLALNSIKMFKCKYQFGLITNCHQIKIKCKMRTENFNKQNFQCQIANKFGAAAVWSGSVSTIRDLDISNLHMLLCWVKLGSTF